MASKNKKAVLGDSDSIQSNGSSDMPLDPIESHTHCCAIDFDETVRQVSAIKGELGDIATHTMVNTLNQLKYIKAIKDRSELKKRVAAVAPYPQRVSSSSLSTRDVLDVTAVPESEKPYSKRSIRVPGSESEPLAISSLRPHSEEDGTEKQGVLRQGSVHVMKHAADADTSEENYLFELPRRSSIAETKGESGPGGRRHSKVLSLKQIPSEVSVDPLTDYLKRNASNFRKSLGERDLTTESGMLGPKEQVQERVSNDSVLTPEQRLSEREFPIDEQDNLDNQKVDDVIAPKIVPEDEDNRSISKKSDEDLVSEYSKKSDEDLTPKYVSGDEDDKLVIQKSEEDISAKEMSTDEDKKSVDRGSDEDIVTKSVSEDDFPEVLSLGDVEDSSIQIGESVDIFTIEMSEDYLPDVASVLVEETKDDENEQECVVLQKISGEKIDGTRMSPVPSYKEEPKEKNQAGKDFKISKDVQESLQKEVILPPISLPKEPVTKVESKESVAEQTDRNAAAADEKSPRKPKVRTLNTENMKNRDYYYMDILPKQTDSIIQFTIDSKLGNKKVKCDFSGNVSVNIIVSDDKLGETRSKKPKLKVLDLSNDEGTKIEKVKRRKVSFDDQTGKRIWKRVSQLHVYIVLANNYSSLLTYLLKSEENSYCRNKTECLEFDTKYQKRDSNRCPSDGAANGKNLSTSSLSILNLINAIIYITRFLRAAEKSNFVENFMTDFSEFFYQEKTSNIYHEFPRVFNYNNKHETVSVAETVKFLTRFRFPEFYEKISENNKFQVMPLEQKRKPFQSFNDIDNEGNIQINLIGASSDTVTVAKKEESENGKNYNVFEIVIPHKPSFKQKRAEATGSDDESTEYRLYKKSYGEPRAVSATRDSRASKVSNESERRRSVLFADETTVHDPNNVPVNTAETQKDTAPLYQSGEPNELQQTSGTQKTDIGESDLGSNDEYLDDENVNQTSDAQPVGSRFDPNSNNYIYAAAPRFASPFADENGRPLPDRPSAVEIFESDVDNMPEFADVADAKYRVDKRITSSSKKGDTKQPISENVKPEQEKITADLHPISEKVKPEKHKRDVKSQPEREKFQSRSEKTDENLQAVPNAVQPHEELAQQDRLVPSISDMDISKRRVPIKNITPEESLAGTEPEVNFPSISEKGEYDGQLGTRVFKPPSQQGKTQFDEHTDKPFDAHKRHDYETDALQYPEKAGHKKFNTETNIVPNSKVTDQTNGKYGKDMYSPHGSISHSYEDQPLKPDKGKYSPHGSLSLSHKEQPMKPDEGKYSPHGSLSPLHEEKPMKPVEGKYSPRGSLSPSYEERPTKPVEGKYSPRGSVSHSHEERPMKPVEGKYSPHGILPPSAKEKPTKPVEGKYSPHDSLSPSYEERPMKPVTGKYSPRDSLSPSHEEQPMKPVEEKYSPHASLLPSREEQPMKAVEGKYSPHGILPLSGKEKPMKPVEGKYSPHGSLSPLHEGKPMRPVEGKYSPSGSLSPSYEKRPIKPDEGKYSPHGSLLPSRERQPMKPVEDKYSPHSILRPSDKEQPMKSVDSLSYPHKAQPMKPIEEKYSPHGSLSPLHEEQPMKPVEGKYSPHDSLSPSYEERPMKLVTGKYSPGGSLSPSHEEQPMKSVEGKYSPHGILPPSDKEQPMDSVDSLSYPHKDQPMKPVEGKYSPHDSLSHSYEEQPMEPVGGKYSPHGSILPSREEQSMKPVTGKYSPHDSFSPSREGQPMKPVEGKYSSFLSPHDKQSSKAVQGEYSPHDGISPSAERKHSTPSPAEKQPISDSPYKSEAKIPKVHQRPEEMLLPSADSETSQIFEMPDIYEDKYTAYKYSSLKAYWPYDKRSVRLSTEERQDTKATMAQKGSDTIRPQYLAGDPVSVKSKTPEETDYTKLKPVHEDIIDKKTYTPYREGINYGRNLDHDSLDSEGEDSSANKINGEKEDEYSPGKRSWLSSGKFVTPVEEPPFVKTLKEDDSQTKSVKFSDGTRPIRGDIRSILKPPDKPDEADTFVGSPDKTEGLKNDRPKERQGEQFMVYAGHVGESSPFLHKSDFDGSPIESDDDHGSSESDSSSVRRFNNTVDSKVNGPKSDNIFPYKNEQLVYAGEIEERSPFSYDDYMLQRESNYSRQQQDESYSQQRDPKYKQQRGPSYSQRDSSYSLQRDLTYSQQQDPSYSQQPDSRYLQKRDPSYSQQQDPSYAQQGPSYSQQRDPSYAQQQYKSYSQQRDPSYSQQRDPGYGQQKDLNNFQVSSQLKKYDTGGTQKVSFEESPQTEISKYEVTLPQKQKRDDDQVETEGRAVIILVKAKHIVPKKNGKINVVDSSQNELELESERDKRKEGFKSDKNNMETMTEGDYDPDLIDDDETTFCTQGTQISTRGLVDSTRSSRTPSETLKKGKRPSDSSRSRKDSKLKWSQEVEPTFYTEGTQTILKGEDIVATKLSDEDKIRGEEITDGTAYQSEYGPPDVTRRIESIVSQQSKMNGTRIPVSSTEEPEKTKRPTYSSDSSKSRKDTRLKSLPEDKTAFYNEGTQTILKGADIVTTKISDKDKTPEVDVTNGTAIQSEYGSSDVTRRIESIDTQQSKENGTRVSFLPSEEQKKGKRPTYDFSERRRDRKIKESLTRKEHDSRWIADESKRRLQIPEFEVVASAAVSKLPMKNQPIQPKFYKGDLAYSMNVQSDRFNGTCNFYLDPKLRKAIRNALIACADKKK